jgi:hypothetical protein
VVFSAFVTIATAAAKVMDPSAMIFIGVNYRVNEIVMCGGKKAR